MNLNIQSIHFTPSEALNSYITEKISKLDHFNIRIESGEVCLRLDKSAKAGNKVCEIRLAIPGNDLFAKRQCQTFEEATNQAIEALQKQLRRKKTILNKKR